MPSTHRQIGLTRQHGHDSRAVSFQDGVHRLQTLGEHLPTTLPDAGWHPSSSWSDSRHCQKEHARAVPMAMLLLKKNEKQLFSARNVVFSLWAPPCDDPRVSGGWSDSLQALGRFAPGGGANRSTPHGKYVGVRMSQREDLAGVRKRRLQAGLRSLGATLPAPSGPGFRRCRRRDRRGQSPTAARTAAVR